MRTHLERDTAARTPHRVAFVVANEGVEESELTTPWQAVIDAGDEPVLVAPERARVQLMAHLDKTGQRDVDVTTTEAAPQDFSPVVLPGGVVNPDRLRSDRPALEFLRAMFRTGKPCAVICHGPWTLVEAGLVAGRTLTSWPSIKTDLENAGATWIDVTTAICTNGPNTLLSSRLPADLPAFCAALIELIRGEADNDLVDEAGDESSPASDPPALSIT